MTPDDLHLPGCLEMEERNALLEKFRSSDLIKKEYEVQMNVEVRQNKVTRDDVSRTLLSVTIPHAGYVIISCKDMQKHHKVSMIKFASYVCFRILADSCSTPQSSLRLPLYQRLEKEKKTPPRMRHSLCCKEKEQLGF